MKFSIAGHNFLFCCKSKTVDILYYSCSNNVKRRRQSYFYYVLNDLRNAVSDDENCVGQDVTMKVG